MLRQALLSAEALAQAVGRLPRVRLAYLPTPLEACPRLSQELGVRVLIKRDDLTGLAFGGNKARHLEFRLADALARGCDVFINSNEWVSNNARLVAAACAKVGLRYVFIVRNGHGKPLQGNLLLDYLLGSDLHLLQGGDRAAAQRYAREVAERLRAQGHTPYVAPDEPFARISGTVGYLLATLELAEQLAAAGVEGEVYVYLVAGTSMAGLALGARLLGLPWRVRGMYVGDRPDIEAQVLDYAQQVRERLGLPATLEPAEAPVWDVTGPAYAVPSPEGVEAIKLVARTEAVLLDPNYTGKAMGGLLGHVRQGLVPQGATVVFVHTGGLPALFVDPAALTAPDFPAAVTP